MTLAFYWISLAALLITFFYTYGKNSTVTIWATISFAIFLNYGLPWHLFDSDIIAQAFRLGILTFFAGSLIYFRKAVERQSRKALLFVLVMVLMTIYTVVLFQYTLDWIKVGSFLYRVILPCMLIALSFRGRPEEIRGLAIGAAAGGIIMTLYMLAYGDQTHHGRLDMLTGSLGTITATRCVAFSLVALLWLWLCDISHDSNRVLRNLPYFLITSLLLFGVLFGGTRGPAVALIASALVIAAWKLTRQGIFSFTYTSLILAGISIIGFLVFANVSDGMSTQLGSFSIFRGLEKSDGLDQNALSRLELWAIGIDLIKQHPFGLGLGGYENVTGFKYPHNLFIEVGVELGWVAAILMIVIVASISVKLAKAMLTGSVEATFLMAMLVFWLGSAMFSFSMDRNEGVFFSLIFSMIWLGRSGLKPTSSLARGEPPRGFPRGSNL